MQLRQLAPDVVRDVVVRFVESILYEILYARKRNGETATTRFDETRALPIELWHFAYHVLHTSIRHSF